MTRPYVDAIEARGIPHLLVGGKAFHGREEVEAIRAVLAAIEWPDDELSTFAALKGPLFAIDDEHLFEFKSRFGTFHPFRVPPELGGNSGQDLALTAEPTTHLMPIADALRLLQQLHRGAELSSGRRHDRPAARGDARARRLHPAAGGRAGARQRPAHRRARASVRGRRRHLVPRLHRRTAAGGASTEAAEAPILEEGSDGVRLMTVHKAKGLEFPVVILADLTCRMSRSDASRYLDPERGLCAIRLGGWAPHELQDHEAEEVARDEAEGVRLAYVAATRARDLLVVPALGDEPWDGGWLQPAERRAVSAAAEPADARRAVRSVRRSSRRTPCWSGRTTRRRRRRPCVPVSTSSRAAIPSSGGIPAR